MAWLKISRIWPDQDSSHRTRFLAGNADPVEASTDIAWFKASERPVERHTYGVRLNFSETRSVRRRAKRFRMPRRRVTFEIAVLDADAHVLADREPQAGEGLPGKDSVAVRTLQADVVHRDVIGIQNRSAAAHTSAHVRAHPIISRQVQARVRHKRNVDEPGAQRGGAANRGNLVVIGTELR